MAEQRSFNCTDDFSEVCAAELREIQQRRTVATGAGSSLDECRETLTGLALSGGGVRSGATSLGLIQALDSKDVLEHVDYMSTVSGGSYAGAYLSSQCLRQKTGDDLKDVRRPPLSIREQPQKSQPERILSFVHSGSYFRDAAGFFNRQLFGMVLVMAVVICGLLAVSSLVAFTFRCLDYPAVRFWADGIGFNSELRLMFLPSIALFFVWLAMWGISYWRRTSTRRIIAARYVFWALVFSLGVAVASLISSGEVYLGNSDKANQIGAVANPMLHRIWLVIVAAVSAALIPYLSPKRLLRSGANPSNIWEKIGFKVASYAVIFGVPFIFVGIMLEENISGINERRTDQIVSRSELIGWERGDTWAPFWRNTLDDIEANRSSKLPHFKVEPYEQQVAKEGGCQPDADFNAVLQDQLKRHKPQNLRDELKNLLGSLLPDGDISICQVFEGLAILHERMNDAKNDELSWGRAYFWMPLDATSGRSLDSHNPFRRYRNCLVDSEEIKKSLSLTIGQLMASPAFPQLISSEIGFSYLPDDRRNWFPDWFFESLSRFWVWGELKFDLIRYIFRGIAIPRTALAQPSEIKFYFKSLSAGAAKQGFKADSVELASLANVLQQLETLGNRHLKTIRDWGTGDAAKREKAMDEVREIARLNRKFLDIWLKQSLSSRSDIWSFVVLRADQKTRLRVFGVSLLLFLILASIVNLNATSVHDYYRRQLADMWIDYVPGLGKEIPLSQMETTDRGYPYHLIVGSLAYFGKYRRGQGKYSREDHFIFSQRFCGSERTGYVESADYMNGSIQLDDATAISGAAVSVLHISNPLIGFVLFLTNLRLGQWLDNPRFNRLTATTSGRISKILQVTPLAVMFNWFKYADDRPHVFVADGGHFENLAIDELLRRRCRTIFALDAGADPDSMMSDLVRLIRWARMKHGIIIRPLDEGQTEAEFVAQITKTTSWLHRKTNGTSESRGTDRSKLEFSEKHFLVWKIEYPADGDAFRTGILIYMKTSMTGDESIELIKHARDNPEFPHDPTTDQFYAPNKFESYRRLGQHIGETVIDELRAALSRKEVCKELKESLAPILLAKQQTDRNESTILRKVEKLFGKAGSDDRSVSSDAMKQLEKMSDEIDTDTMEFLLDAARQEGEIVASLAKNMIDESDRNFDLLKEIAANDMANPFTARTRKLALDMLENLRESFSDQHKADFQGLLAELAVLEKPKTLRQRAVAIQRKLDEKAEA